jgi:hypothetical protein
LSGNELESNSYCVEKQVDIVGLFYVLSGEKVVQHYNPAHLISSDLVFLQSIIEDKTN